MTRTFKALSLLENEHAPMLKRRSPYWRPRPSPASRECHLPAWSWTHPDYSDDLALDLTILDAVGAFVSAASSANFAHGALEHTGALPTPPSAKILPGYYRIDAHMWSYPHIVSPLGAADVEGKIWIAHPTMELLCQLADLGKWPALTIHDSWTCSSSVRLREWATAVNLARADALRALAHAEAHGTAEEIEAADDWYENGVKGGYAMAVQMMRGPAEDGPVKSAVKRPDWYDTIHAQHAASTWRKIWRVMDAGYIPVMMGAVDEVVYLTQDFENIVADNLIKLDPTRVQLGAFRVKDRIVQGAAV